MSKGTSKFSAHQEEAKPIRSALATAPGMLAVLEGRKAGLEKMLRETFAQARARCEEAKVTGISAALRKVKAEIAGIKGKASRP